MPRLSWTCAFLLGAAWLLPLHVLPWMSWHNEMLAIACALAAGAALFTRRAHGARVALPSVTFLPLFIAAFALAQWLAGRIVHAGSLLAILSYAALCVASACAGHAVAGPRGDDAPVPALRILALLLLALGVAQVAIVFAQTYTVWMGSDWIARTANPTRGGGNVAQPNQAALLFLMAMAATFYLRQRALLGVVGCVALLMALAAGFATTESRSGMLAFAVLVAWGLWRRDAMPLRVPAWSVAAYALLVLLLFVAWPSVIGMYWNTPEEAVNLTSSGRLDMWSQFVAAIGLRPWAGWGVMQVAEAQNAIAHLYPEVKAATFSHNVFLDLALWIGVPGLLVACALTAAWSWPRLRAARSLDTVFCVAVALPAAVQSLTEFPYAYAYILVPVMFALGVLDAKVGPAPMVRLPRAAFASVLVAWAAATAWSLVEYVRIEEDFRVARFEALRVGATPTAYEVPQTHLLTQLDALLRATRVKPRPAMPPQDLALLRDVAMLYPWGATNFRYATALALNGQVEEAARQLQVLRALQGQKSFDRLMQVLDEMAVEHPVLKQLRQP